MTILNASETSCRRSIWEKRSSTHYSPNECIILTDIGEPEGYDEVILDTHRDKWKEAIVEKHEFCGSVVGMKPVKSSST
ncbi:hypothetical protein MTR67_025763 [Solanum verrucosum]|uniref:Uncharacterized protein n=1 Tax=Solanum verrucosum TaxID=315347 RepID=A0AAF0TZH9_SOLVR|nr:hypothetical protein MTR67_025763 [Solanum verrucosum]